MGGASSKGEGSIQSSKMEVFGLESHKENIKKYLIHGDPESLGVKISGESKSRNTTLAIWGESGSGKTTLARCVYDDIDVSHHFHKRAWFTVGTICKARDILESLYYSLTSASKTMEDIKLMSGLTLTNEVYKELDKNKPWLIVLDDVCSANDISEQSFFSAIPREEENPRSRIIITTRSLESVKGYNPKIEYKMPSLEKEEQWKLFKRRSELQDEDLKREPRFKIGRSIIDSLGGLPLEILLAADTLRSKSTEFWDNYYKLLNEDPKPAQSLLRAVALRHNNLPAELQQCLHYLRQFPTDEMISAEKLCLLWMAEGMIQPMPSEAATALEVARKYYKDLRDSRLVIEVERGDVSPSSQSFALCKALCNDDVPPRPPPRKYSGAKQIGQTLFFDETSSEKQTAGSSKHSKEVRALDYNGVKFAQGKFLEGVEKLQGLKYLSFQGCSLPAEFPKLMRKRIANITSLETLDLRVADSTFMCIPDVLGTLSKLRHLYFPRAFETEKKELKLKLEKLEHLEVLENFHAGKCNSGDLKSLKKLRSLTCIEVEMIEDLKNILKAIEKKNEYFRTSLVVKKIDVCSTEYKGTVQEMFACHHIQILHIEGCHLGEFPTGFQFGSNFTEMVLDNTTFEDDDLLLRKKHPSLKSLVLRKNALSKAKKMVFQDEYFPKLTSLKLENLKSLKEFEVNKAVPLAVLTISKCGELKELPVHELAEMRTLKRLITPESYEDQVKKINDERKKGKKHIGLATA